MRPRFAGGDGEALARGVVRDRLERAGFECREQAFTYSQWPGKWGPPVAAALQLATILAVSRTAMSGRPLAAFMLGVAVATILLAIMRDAKRRWTIDFPFMRARSWNLEATRGSPRFWIVAHIDSKSQSIPMLARIASSIAAAAVALATGGLLLAGLPGASLPANVWRFVELAAIASAIPSMLCWVGNASHGALDNATGVAAAVLAAEAVDRDGLGMLITSGEELGLAGARDWVRSRPRDIVVLNCDTFDDDGVWRCMTTRAVSQRVTAAVETSTARMGSKMGVGRMIPGILADSIAFSDVGIEAVTLSRGKLSTLARIHTRRDNSAALTGKGVAEAARLLADLARQLG